MFPLMTTHSFAQTTPVIQESDLPTTIGPRITVVHNPAPPPKTTVLHQQDSRTSLVVQRSPAPPPRTTPVTRRSPSPKDGNNTYDSIDIDMPDLASEVRAKPMADSSSSWPRQGRRGGGPRDSGYSPGSGGNSSRSSSQSQSPQEVNGHAGASSTNGTVPSHFTRTPDDRVWPGHDNTYCLPEDAGLDHIYAMPPDAHLAVDKLQQEEEICETTFDEDTLANIVTDIATATPIIPGQDGGQPTVSVKEGALGMAMSSGQTEPSSPQHTQQSDLYTVVVKGTLREEEEDEEALPSTFKPWLKPQRQYVVAQTPPSISSGQGSDRATDPAPAPPPVHPTGSSMFRAPEDSKAEQMAELKQLPNIQRRKLELERKLKGVEVESLTAVESPTNSPIRRVSIPEALQNLPPGPPIGVSASTPPTQPKEAPVKKRHSFKILRRNSKKEETPPAVPPPIEEGSRQPTSTEQRRQSIRVATSITSQEVGEFQSVFQNITKRQSQSAIDSTAAPTPMTSVSSDDSAPVPMTLTSYSASQPNSHPSPYSSFQPTSSSASQALSQPLTMTVQQPNSGSQLARRPALQSTNPPSGHLHARTGGPTHATAQQTYPGHQSYRPSTTASTHQQANLSQPLSLSQVVPGLTQQQAMPSRSGVSQFQRATTMPYLHANPASFTEKIEPISTAPMNTKRDKKRKSFRRRKTESTFK